MDAYVYLQVAPGRVPSVLTQLAGRAGLRKALAVVGSWDVLVNATPAGMFPDVEATPWPEARFDGRLVYDLVYNPQETRLLREARAAGLDTLGGLDMLVAQAAAQFTCWTGRQPDVALMRAAAESRLRAFAASRAGAPTASLS